MRARKKRPDRESSSDAVFEVDNDAQENMRTNMYSSPAEWNYWGDKKEDAKEAVVPDYALDAITAANEIDADINQAWTLSQNNTAGVKPHEYAGGIVKRADGTYDSVNQKEGREGDSKPKVKKSDLGEGDVAAGDYHTHPWSPEDIKDLQGTAYTWDGQGQGPSGADFISLASQKLTDGHFSIIESGTVRYIIVVTDAKAFKSAFIKETNMTSFTMEATINDEINKAVGDKMNMENNPDATNPLTYPNAYLLGLINGLKEVQKENKNADIGMKLLKSKPDNKTEYDTVYP